MFIFIAKIVENGRNTLQTFYVNEQNQFEKQNVLQIEPDER